MHDYGSYAGAKNVTVNDLLSGNHLKQAKFRLAVIPDELDIDQELEDTIRLVRAAGNAVLVFDEVGDYRQKNEQTLNRIARNGRHDGIVPIYVSQVAIDIPYTVRRLATRVYSFAQFHPADIKALSEVYGESFAQSVKDSKGHEFNVWTLPTLPNSKSTVSDSRNGGSETPPQS